MDALKEFIKKKIREKEPNLTEAEVEAYYKIAQRALMNNPVHDDSIIVMDFRGEDHSYSEDQSKEFWIDPKIESVDSEQ